MRDEGKPERKRADALAPAFPPRQTAHRARSSPSRLTHDAPSRRFGFCSGAGTAHMNTTSPSLLERLRQPDAAEAWRRFVHLYTPLLYYWARRLGMQPPDASDLVQEVFAILIQKLPKFAYDQHKSFRNWLRTVMFNKWRDQRRLAKPPVQADTALFAELEAPDNAAWLGEEEYRQNLVRRALQIMRADFQPTTWKACWEYVVRDRPAAEVAEKLGISVGNVYVAKSRVLSRLRQELEGLLD